VEIYIEETSKISELRSKAAEAFAVSPTEIKLYKADWLREPALYLKNDNAKLSKEGIKGSDLILAVPRD